MVLPIMNIELLFQNLAHAELSNLALVDEDTGNIKNNRKPSILVYADEGLLRLYSRFILKTNDLIVEPVEHITNYYLLPRFAENHEPKLEPYTYIKDLPLEPFEGDVIKILDVFNIHGQKLPLNDSEQPRSLFTPQANVLQVPYKDVLTPLNVVYQARHKPLDISKPEQNIYLPDVLHAALRSYIAHKVYGNMNTEGSTANALSHLSAYEAVCFEAETKDLVNNSNITTNTIFRKRGWV